MDQTATMILSAVISGLTAAVGATAAAKRAYKGQVAAAERTATATVAAAETAARAARDAAELNERSARAVAEIARESQRTIERDKALREYRTALVRPFFDRADQRMSEYVAFSQLWSDRTISDEELKREYWKLQAGSLFLQGAVLGAFATGTPMRDAADDLATTENRWLNVVSEAVRNSLRDSKTIGEINSYWSTQYTGRLDNTHRVAIAYIFE